MHISNVLTKERVRKQYILKPLIMFLHLVYSRVHYLYYYCFFFHSLHSYNYYTAKTSDLYICPTQFLPFSSQISACPSCRRAWQLSPLRRQRLKSSSHQPWTVGTHTTQHVTCKEERGRDTLLIITAKQNGQARCSSKSFMVGGGWV